MLFFLAVFQGAPTICVPTGTKNWAIILALHTYMKDWQKEGNIQNLAEQLEA
jgi:hypothetical protein